MAQASVSWKAGAGLRKPPETTSGGKHATEFQALHERLREGSVALKAEIVIRERDRLAAFDPGYRRTFFALLTEALSVFLHVAASFLLIIL